MRKIAYDTSEKKVDRQTRRWRTGDGYDKNTFFL